MGVDLKKCFGLIREPTEDEQRSFGFPSACDFQQVENRQEATPVPPSLSYCQHFSRPFFDSDRCSVPPESSSTGRDSPLQQSPIGVGTGGGSAPTGIPLTVSTDYFYMFEWDAGIGDHAVDVAHAGIGARVILDGGVWSNSNPSPLHHIHADNWDNNWLDPSQDNGRHTVMHSEAVTACDEDPETDPDLDLFCQNIGHNFTTPPQAFLPDPGAPIGNLRWIDIVFRTACLGSGPLRLLVFQGDLLASPDGPTGTLIGQSEFLSAPGGTVRFELSEVV